MEEIRTGSAERVLERILECAASEGASDIHMEPQASLVRVRFREDGVLYERFHLPLQMLSGLSVRSKVIGHMNVGESGCPRTEAAVHLLAACPMISVFLSSLLYMEKP